MRTYSSFRPSVRNTITISEENSQYDEPEPQSEDELPPVMSFRNAKYESKDMLKLLSLHDPPEKIPPGLNSIGYASSDVLPEWILSNPTWKNAPKQTDNQNEISEILKMPASKRTSEQISTIVHWLMSVWGIANTMGFKRCDAMIKEFKYQVFEEGENVIQEGDRGLTFYIIISGNTTVFKDGIGVVGQLGKGKSFGEIALTQGKDLRTATVTAITKLEVLSLHKNDYDYFVRDIQETERRENFQILSNCNLFKSWPKGKIDKICNTCTRKTFEAGAYIFRQGDPPDDLCVIVEGSVDIIKELVIVCKNRWPVATNQWKERVKKITKPIMLKTLQRGDYFGEVAIIKNIPRSTSAIAASRCVLISLDKLEFLHLVNSGSASVNILEDQDGEMSKAIQKYVVDEDLIAAIGDIKGGPGSAALVGDVSLTKADLEYQKRYGGLPPQLSNLNTATVDSGGSRNSSPNSRAGSPSNALQNSQSSPNGSSTFSPAGSPQKGGKPRSRSPSPMRGRLLPGNRSGNRVRIASPMKARSAKAQAQAQAQVAAREKESKKLTIKERVNKISKQESIAEQLTKVAQDKKKFDESVQEKAKAILEMTTPVFTKSSKAGYLDPNILFAPSSSANGGSAKLNSSLPQPGQSGFGMGGEKSSSEQSKLKNKLEALRAGVVPFTSSSIHKRGHRYSLKGLDNDSQFVFDPNKVVLRRNSAISLGLFYDHIKTQLEDGTAEAPRSAGADGEQINGRAAAAGGILRGRRSSVSAPPQSLIQAYQHKKQLMQQQRQQHVIEECDSEDDDSCGSED